MSLFSPTEEYGLSLLTDNDRKILSVGISTSGAAEIRMAKQLRDRRIIATTLDEQGANDTRKDIEIAGLDNRIEVKVEDIAGDQIYPDNYFDFVYARLVLHYLSAQELEKALKNISHILKNDDILYVVVRSTLCDDANDPSSTFDSKTHLTTYPSGTYKGVKHKRYFHDDNSITQALSSFGIIVKEIEHIKETLASDFKRNMISKHDDDLIRIVAINKKTEL